MIENIVFFQGIDRAVHMKSALVSKMKEAAQAKSSTAKRIVHAKVGAAKEAVMLPYHLGVKAVKAAKTLVNMKMDWVMDKADQGAAQPEEEAQPGAQAEPEVEAEVEPEFEPMAEPEIQRL